MRESLSIFFYATLSLLLMTATSAFAVETSSGRASRSASALVPAKGYTIAYYESGPFSEFSKIFEALKENLATYNIGRQLRFPEQYHYSPGPGQPKSVYDNTAKSIMENKNIDMVVVMGSVASQTLLRHNNGKIPVICLDVDDPVGMGLINPATGQPTVPNFVVDYVSDKWQQSINLLHIVHSFKKIGAIAIDTARGRSHSNIIELLAVGRERGFSVVTWPHLDEAESVASCRKGIEYLLQQGVDSMYIPALNCFDPISGDPKQLFEILHTNGIKTYAKDGKIPVSHGALLGVSTQDYWRTGEYYARRIVQILSGTPPSPKDQLPFEPKIYLNTATGRKLDTVFPNSLLINVDGIYDDALPAILERP